MDLPSVFEAINCSNHIRLDRLASLKSLALKTNRARLQDTEMAVPVGSLTVKPLLHFEDSMSLNQVVTLLL